MARIKWVQMRLQNWALWKAREDAGGLGYPTSSSFLNEVVDGGYREAIIPVDDCDAALTNDAVESLRIPRPHLYAVLQCTYIQSLTARESALHMGKAESTIKALLCVADQAVQTWFVERNAKKERSFTP